MASSVVGCRVGACVVARSQLQQLCTASVCVRCLSVVTDPMRNSIKLPKPLPTISRATQAGVHSEILRTNTRKIPSPGNSCQGAVKRFQATVSADALSDEITSTTDPIQVLNLTSRHRSRLTHLHVYQAFNHLWHLAKFHDGPYLACFLEVVRGHPEFDALCVLAENKLKDVDGKLLVDTLYAALRLTPEVHHPFVRELRTEINHRLDEFETDTLSKLVVCLQDMNDNRSPMFCKIVQLFSDKLHKVDSIRELSAWMREVIHLVSPPNRQAIFQKASQLLAEANPADIGDNSLRRVIQTMARSRSISQPLLNQCSQLLLGMIENIPVKESCMVQSMLESLDYENKELREAIRKTIAKKLPDCQDPDELSYAMETIGGVASANIKLLLADKAEEIVSILSPSAISHMSVGLRLMGYRTQNPLVRKLVKRIKAESSNLQVEGIADIVGFLTRVDNLDSEVFTLIQERLLEILRSAFSPSRVLGCVSSLSQLPSLDSLDHIVLERVRAMMPQLHIAGINHMLLATSRIARKLDKSGTPCQDFLNLKQELFERAQVSIDKITSIHYLNNIAEIILQDGGHVLVLDAAMKQSGSILHRLTPQLAVECARILFRARYLQRDLMDRISEVATHKMNKITPMQVLYILSPFCTLNYLPPNAPQFFQACVARCEPFLDSLPSGYLVDLTHILTFLQQFHEPFIRHIFSLDFLTKLDEELETIPDRSMMYRRKLMYLNRTVALECPELQVPWFHEQFSQDLLKKRSLTLDSSLMLIQSALVEVLGGAQYVRSFVVSPYYYDISFECVLDSDGNPLACADYGSVLNRSEAKVAGTMLADLMQWGTQTKQLPHGAQRVAIDFLSSSLFCINSRRTLGMVALKRRHMELMGYRYVQIPHFVWSSQALTEREERTEYLRQLIFSPNEEQEQEQQEQGLDVGSSLGEMLTGRVQPKLPKNLGIQEEGLLEDEMVLKVLNTFDKIR
ncbi:FAST kinase domain-containing protein 1, mitochondrial-like isoform X1 [Patiria miniata]|uniref:RAP domain-containing protein n=1 Tax=Patiria miniata TaxID=46514 RepID=A0A914BRB8_PATMI|nr:FAST kinase domain-containing protein 1, mitochondrial-like isoform X1 [Patiria miniata]XP_038078185.1 FAST kinase domain-containing protein 1, mitochondrial-like isoform X1 [Patiria miniata]XP_038078186.1 FAST kinase domain-containing protein 1, mitochondrial-like isoform X2 [Patiria miniata]XP_038078187.1 FAST kinase domain-containing protein 1, mitochondrial-like isoform X1 [Patiria miniata]